MAGVLRVHVRPSAFVLPAREKRSFAVVGHDPQRLTSTETERGFRCEAGALSIDLVLDGFSFLIADASGRTLARALSIDGDARSKYPTPSHHAAVEFESPAGDAYLGFGEKVGPLDKRGLRFSFWNTDVMPHHPDTDPLYVSIPFFIGLRDGVAWGCFLDETWRSDIDVAMTEPDRVRWLSHGPELDLYFFAGPTIADVVRRYVALTGRAPLPPLWALGVQQSRWGYETETEIRGVVESARNAGFPFDVVYLDIDHQDAYRVFTVDRARFPDVAGLARDCAATGVRLVPIIDPALKLEDDYGVYRRAKERDLLVRTDRGDTLVGAVWPKPAVFPDFTREETRTFWAEEQRAFLDHGFAGIWIDMNEPSCFSVEPGPGDLVPHGLELREERDDPKTLPMGAMHGALRHREVHNVYGLCMAQATFEGLQSTRPDARPFVLSRAGYAGIQRYAAVWTGDNSSYWSHLELSMAMMLGLGLSGVAFSGVDVPGFLGAPTPELAARWAQLASFQPLLRFHSAKGTPYKEPWRLPEPHRSIARAACELRYRLLPYLYTCFEEASRTGLPVVRPLAMIAPDDREALVACDQLLLGDALLVAPVVRPGRTDRSVYLPRGQWLQWSSLRETTTLHEGGRRTLVEAPLDTVPVFLRAGEAVPLTEPALHTTSADWPSLTWHLHLAPEVRGALYEDAGDGHGSHRRTMLRGTYDGALRLVRTIEGHRASPREHDFLQLHGGPRPARVTGGRLLDDGRIALSGDELRVEW